VTNVYCYHLSGNTCLFHARDGRESWSHHIHRISIRNLDLADDGHVLGPIQDKLTDPDTFLGFLERLEVSTWTRKCSRTTFTIFEFAASPQSTRFSDSGKPKHTTRDDDSDCRDRFRRTANILHLGMFKELVLTEKVLQSPKNDQ
jgi:hypothetical protein